MFRFDSFFIDPLVQAAERTGWEGWPFTSPDGEFSLTASVARVLFVLAVFFFLGWLLRKLFGPGGPMRPDEFGTSHITERKRRQAEMKELRERYRAGEIDREEYLAALDEAGDDR